MIKARGTNVTSFSYFSVGQYSGIRNILSVSRSLVINVKHGFFDPYDTIIVFDSVKLAFLLFILTRKKIVVWRWNTYDKYVSKLFTSIMKYFITIWTFDTQDAQEYGFKLNTQFYFFETSHVSIDQKIDNISYDLYFVGQDKGRYSLISFLKQELIQQKITYNINLIPETNVRYNEFDNDIISNKFIEYDKVLKGVMFSKAVLDITKVEQTGLTLRILEAVYYNKKIITNNTNIKKTRIYSPQKVFIIGEDNIKLLKNFIHSKPISYHDEVKRYYDFSEWLKRFNI